VEVKVRRVERYETRKQRVLRLDVVVIKVVAVDETAAFRRVPVEVDVERDAAVRGRNVAESRVT